MLVIRNAHVKNKMINLEKDLECKLQDGTFDVIVIPQGSSPISRRIFSKRFINGFNKRALTEEDTLGDRKIIICPIEDGEVKIIFNSALIYMDTHEKWNDNQLLPSYGMDRWCDERNWDEDNP